MNSSFRAKFTDMPYNLPLLLLPTPQFAQPSLHPPTKHTHIHTYQLLEAVAENGHHFRVDDLNVSTLQVLHNRVQQIEQWQLLVHRDLDIRNGMEA